MAQTFQNFEIVFVDSESTDNTRDIINELVKQDNRIKLVTITKSSFSYGRAINLGISNTRESSDYIIILSAHAYPTNTDWLNNFVSFIQDDPNICGVFGKQEVFQQHLSNWIVRYQNDGGYQSFYPDHSYTSGTDYKFSNANAIIRKEIWKKFPFDETLPYTEDWLWAKTCLAKGYTIGYCAESSVYHSHPDSIKEYIKRRKNEIKGTNSVIPNVYKKPTKKKLFRYLSKVFFTNMFKKIKQKGLKNGVVFSLVELLDTLILYKYA